MKIWKIEEELKEIKTTINKNDVDYIYYACFTPDSEYLFIFLNENRIFKLSRAQEFEYNTENDVICNAEFNKIIKV